MGFGRIHSKKYTLFKGIFLIIIFGLCSLFFFDGTVKELVSHPTTTTTIINSHYTRNLKIDDKCRTAVNDFKECRECSCLTQFDILDKECGFKPFLFLDYLQFYYCTFQTLPALAVIILIFWMLFLFYLLVNTTEEYFFTGLSKLSETLKLSQNIAGVTLLAFGNGGPDIFAAFTAITQNAPGMALGSLLGAGMFVTSFVVGLISISCQVTVNRRPFIRDVLFYFIILVSVFFVVRDGQIHLWESIAFISLWVVYTITILLVRYMNQYFKKKKKRNVRYC